jgi:hypothetical protein
MARRKSGKAGGRVLFVTPKAPKSIFGGRAICPKKLFARYPLIQAERPLKVDHPIIVKGDVSPSIAVTVHNSLFLNRSGSARRFFCQPEIARPFWQSAHEPARSRLPS